MANFIALLCLACLPVLAADISGNWEFAVETSQGSGNPSFVFKQDGEKLTGTYTGLFGKAEVNGSVKGNQVEFRIDVNAQGQSGTIRYKGTIESPSRMKGEVDLGELGKGAWTATKK
jgi:hypothetical protein